MDATESIKAQMQHGAEAARKVTEVWQKFLATQLDQFESSLAKLDTHAKEYKARAEAQLQEVNKLATSALTWMHELHAQALDTARELARKVTEPLKPTTQA